MSCNKKKAPACCSLMQSVVLICGIDIAWLYMFEYTSRPADEKLTSKQLKSKNFLCAHLAVLFKADPTVQRKQNSDRPKNLYVPCRVEISAFTYKKHGQNFCSDFNSEHANQPDDPKSGPNLPSDQKVDFSRNWVSGLRVLPSHLPIRGH